MKYKDVQQIAKDTIDFAKKNIKPGMKLLDIRKLCEQKMLELGADSFWYWDVGAFVFAGDETTVSVSGKQYVTSDRIINENDIVTIDLSPQNDNIWGDYARTIILENGVVVDKADVNNVEWRNGLQMEDGLHKELLEFANIETTFEECKNYIVHKDESDFDKNRIDLNLMDSSYFANSITVKTFIIIEKERFIKPRIMRCSPIETYRVLIQSLLPYFSVDNHMVMREVADTLFQNIPAYRLYASESIVTTVDYILGYFKEGKNALQ